MKSRTSNQITPPKTDLSIDDEIYALNYGVCGIDYILHPSEDKIMKGVVTSISLVITKDGSKIHKYHANFLGNKYSFFPVNIGTFIFKSNLEIENHFNKLREERRIAGQFLYK